MNDLVYVRNRIAEVEGLYSSIGLNNAIKQMPKTFAWHNAVISYIEQDKAPNYDTNLGTHTIPSLAPHCFFFF
jgi:hypothetical protein